MYSVVAESQRKTKSQEEFPHFGSPDPSSPRALEHCYYEKNQIEASLESEKLGSSPDGPTQKVVTEAIYFQ